MTEGAILIIGRHVILCKLFLHGQDSGGKTSPQQEMIKCKSWYSKLVSEAKPLRSVWSVMSRPSLISDCLAGWSYLVRCEGDILII